MGVSHVNQMYKIPSSMRKCNTWRNGLMAGTLGGYGKKYRHISLEERDRIEEMKSLGHTVTEIADRTGLTRVQLRGSKRQAADRGSRMSRLSRSLIS